MFHSSAKLVPMKEVLTADQMAHMSSEELNWCGAHFQHIVDFRNRERMQRIEAENRRIFARSGFARRRFD